MKQPRHRPYWMLVYGDERDPASISDLILSAACIIILLLIVLFAANKGFEIRYREIRAAQDDMQMEIRAMQSDLDQIEQAVADWRGIE